MTQEQIIKEYLDKTREGVTIFDNVVILPVRLSGLGLAHRIDREATKENLISVLQNHAQLQDKDLSTLKLSELSQLASYLGLSAEAYKISNLWDRNSSIFLNDLDKWENLPIIENHPNPNQNSQLITFKNAKKQNYLGKVLKAYYSNSEIWGICALFNKECLYKILDLKSTSPAIYSCGIMSNCIVVEMPTSYNHLAFVEKGFWDRKGSKAFDATKINIEKGALIMPNENEVVEVVEKPAEVAEVKSDNDEVKADSITEQVATPEANEVKVDEDEDKKAESKADNDDEVKADEEVAEDKERENLIGDMRELVDSDMTNTLKMPHIRGRKKAGAVLSKFLNANFALIDSKYNDVVLHSAQDCNANYALLVDAYNSLKRNACKEIASVQKATKGWVTLGKPARDGFIAPMKKEQI